MKAPSAWHQPPAPVMPDDIAEALVAIIVRACRKELDAMEAEESTPVEVAPAAVPSRRRRSA